MATTQVQAREFLTELQDSPNLQNKVKEESVEAAAAAAGHDLTKQEVEDAMREIVIQNEITEKNPEDVGDPAEALYTWTHVCTCSCTISC
jgi:phosphoribosyl-ATP pyrophosphohydrolase